MNYGVVVITSSPNKVGSLFNSSRPLCAGNGLGGRACNTPEGLPPSQ